MDIPTDNIHRYLTESCRTITIHAIFTDDITDGYYPSVIIFRRHYWRIISVGITQRVATKITSHAILTDGLSVCNFKGNYRWSYSVGNVPAGNFFLARVRIRLYFRRCFRRWVVFFICDRISDENGIYRWLLYQRTWSVGDAVGIIFTDGVHFCHRRN